jgi:hypothetical protein
MVKNAPKQTLSATCVAFPALRTWKPPNPASDGKPRQFVSKRCVNLISELLEYREDVKENDHATDALRYSLPLELEEKPFLYVVRR